MLKILMATDIPFWIASTGAEQRILALARNLSKDGFQLQTFFLGELADADLKIIKQQSWQVAAFSSENPPRAVLQRLRWYAAAAVNQLQQKFGASPENSPENAPPLTLADYHWPWAIDQFRQTIDDYRPDIVLCQYVTTAYLLSALSDQHRRSVRTILDTHDILHERGSQFETAGYRHWLEIAAKEEFQIWDQFDLVLAIQDVEAELIRDKTANCDVVVAGHTLDHILTTSPATIPAGDRMRVGYIGSTNYSNWHAINRFILEGWPEILARSQGNIELVIAGSICDWFQTPERESAGLPHNIKLIGHISQLEDFYDQIKLVINPVQFGTGLKIKNVEALAFGKPLITTSSGFVGMPETVKEACVVVDNFLDMAEAILMLAGDPQKLKSQGELAAKLARTEFSESRAFSGLRNWILQHKPASFS